MASKYDFEQLLKFDFDDHHRRGTRGYEIRWAKDVAEERVEEISAGCNAIGATLGIVGGSGMSKASLGSGLMSGSGFVSGSGYSVGATAMGFGVGKCCERTVAPRCAEMCARTRISCRDRCYGIDSDDIESIRNNVEKQLSRDARRIQRFGFYEAYRGPEYNTHPGHTAEEFQATIDKLRKEKNPNATCDGINRCIMCRDSLPTGPDSVRDEKTKSVELVSVTKDDGVIESGHQICGICMQYLESKTHLECDDDDSSQVIIHPNIDDYDPEYAMVIDGKYVRYVRFED